MSQNKASTVPYKSTLEKKPEPTELRMYAKIIEDKKHPFNKIPKKPKLDIETIFIKNNKKDKKPKDNKK
tara:strand:- start:293 stop:499 length:207 start_codon:yes stop_codon:yes gene_type:complete